MAEEFRITPDTDVILVLADGTRIRVEWEVSLVRLLVDPPAGVRIILHDTKTEREVVWPLPSPASTPEFASYAAIIAELDRLGWAPAVHQRSAGDYAGRWFAHATRKGYVAADPQGQHQYGWATTPAGALQIVLDEVHALDRQPLSNYPPGADQLGGPEEG